MLQTSQWPFQVCERLGIFLIIWRTESNSRIFRSFYLPGNFNFSVIIRWFVKREMKYTQHFSFRVYNNCQSKLNGLKHLICRTTCRHYAMCTFIATINFPSNLEIIVCCNCLSSRLKTLSVKNLFPYVS